MAVFVGGVLGFALGFALGVVGAIALAIGSDLHGIPLEVVALGTLLGTGGGIWAGIAWRSRRRRSSAA